MAEQEHFNIQIIIQKVVRPERVTTPRRGPAEDDEPRGRHITELVNLKITATDEGEAYAKASQMLNAATPQYLLRDIRPAGAI